MLNPAEKRFIKYWEEQRIGGKYKYYLLYILSGTFISVIVLTFLYSLIVSAFFRIDMTVLMMAAISFVLISFLTIYTWGRNEKKFKAIIKREIKEGQQKDDLV